MPDVAALHLDGDDAGAGDQRQQVDLVVLGLVGDPQVGEHHRFVVELANEVVVDVLLRRRREPGHGGGGSGGHADVQPDERPVEAMNEHNAKLWNQLNGK
ncbi:hypothetical protein GCM10009638_20900 [Luteococcus sanguinis]